MAEVVDDDVLDDAALEERLEAIRRAEMAAEARALTLQLEVEEALWDFSPSEAALERLRAILTWQAGEMEVVSFQLSCKAAQWRVLRRMQPNGEEVAAAATAAAASGNPRWPGLPELPAEVHAQAEAWVDAHITLTALPVGPWPTAASASQERLMSAVDACARAGVAPLRDGFSEAMVARGYNRHDAGGGGVAEAATAVDLCAELLASTRELALRERMAEWADAGARQEAAAQREAQRAAAEEAEEEEFMAPSSRRRRRRRRRKRREEEEV